MQSLRHRGWIIGAVVAVGLTSLFLLSPSGGVARAEEFTRVLPAALSKVQPTEMELRSLEMVNKERAAQKLGPLTMDPLLILVAREHSHEMMEKNYFDHRSPTPGLRTPMDRYLKALGERPPYACVGENLYYCSVADVERSHRALMASLSHRDNILFSRFEKMGVGIYQNDRGEFWVTQMFLTSCDPRAGKTSPSRPPETKQAEAQSAPSAPPDKPASAPPAEAAKSAPTSAPPAESEKPAPDSAGPPSGGAP